MRRVLVAALAVAAASAVACGKESAGSDRAAGSTLAIYASVPVHGPGAGSGAAVELGMRRALADAGGRAGGRDVRLVVLPSTRRGDVTWDPGTVEANAARAADDRSAIAYLGELDQGGSAVSLPVTNRAGLLQISPADGLTSLTRTPPGRPRAGPERYYPAGSRTFARLVPSDLHAARWIVSTLRERGVRRLAILHGHAIADRELESILLALIGSGRPREIGRVTVRGDDPDSVAELVADTAALRPDAVVVAAGGPDAGAVPAAISERLPDVPVFAGPPLTDARAIEPAAGEACALTAVPQPSDLPPRGRRLLAELRGSGDGPVGSEAVLGYDAMRLALAAIDAGGADRRLVVRAARGTTPRDGAAGSYSIGSRGSIEGRPVDCIDRG